MNKKIITVLIAIFMSVSMVACGNANKNNPQQQNTKTAEVSNTDESKSAETTVVTFDTLDELNDIVESNLKNRILSMNAKYEKLEKEINSYKKFSSNIDKIEKFYNNTYAGTREICIKMREYCLDYARLIMASDSDKDDKYDDLDELYDTVYDDGRDELYDEVYDEIFDNMYNKFYGGILDDAYDTVGYKEWSNARSDEYDRWSDTKSEVYEEWSDSGSDIYEFWSDMKSAMWDADDKKAEKVIQDFEEDIKERKEEKQIWKIK